MSRYIPHRPGACEFTSTRCLKDPPATGDILILEVRPNLTDEYQIRTGATHTPRCSSYTAYAVMELHITNYNTVQTNSAKG